VKPIILFVALCLMPAAARAQVTVNPAALQQLAGFVVSPPRPAAPVVPHMVHRTAHKIRPRAAIVMIKPPATLAPKPVAFKPAVSPAPVVSRAPAPVPVVAKPVPPPPPKPALPAPLVVAFASGSAALPGDASAALKPFCAAKGATLIIDAYAPGDPSDPSAAMRLSMSRAFALRQALTACGVPGAQIIPRADGAAGQNLESAKIFVSGAGQ
jgi:hypothetical protein